MRPAVLLFALLAISGCIDAPGGDDGGGGAPTATTPPAPPPEPLPGEVRKVADGATWSIPHRWGNGFLVTHGGQGRVTAGLFSDDWTPAGSLVLVEGEPSPVDHRSLVLDGILYVAWSSGSAERPDSRLDLARFNGHLERVRNVTVVRDSPWNEPTNDFLLAGHAEEVHLGTFHVAAPDIGHRLRSYAANLSLAGDRLLADRPHNNGANLLHADDGWHLVAHEAPSNANRDLVELHYAENWTFLGSRVLTTKPTDEYWTTGVVHDEETGAWYVSHLERAGRSEEFCPTCDMGQVRLKVFDRDWRLVHDVPVTPDGTLAHRPHLLRVRDATYVGYDTADGETGPFRAWVAEFRDRA